MLVLHRPEAELVVHGDHRVIRLGVPGVDRGWAFVAFVEFTEVRHFECSAETVAAVLRADQGVVLVELAGLLGLAGQLGVAGEYAVRGDRDRRTAEMALGTAMLVPGAESFGGPTLGLHLEVVQRDFLVDQAEEFAVLVD